MKKQTQSDKNPKNKPAGQVEGEGSYTATRNYNDGVQKSVAKGNSEDLAKKAADALEGSEAAELARAEKDGKSGKPKRANA